MDSLTGGNVNCLGLVTEADVEHWTEDDIWPYVEHVLEALDLTG